MAWRARNAAARVRPRSAVIEALDRAAIGRKPKGRPCRKQLVKRELSVKDVATCEPELALKIQRAQDLSANDTIGKSWRIAIDSRDHQIGDLVAGLIP